VPRLGWRRQGHPRKVAEISSIAGRAPKENQRCPDLGMAARADTTILDGKLQVDALDWAEYCKQPQAAAVIRAHRAGSAGKG
jgi:hypothetical protein